MSGIGLIRARCKNVHILAEPSRPYTSVTIPLSDGFSLHEPDYEERYACGSAYLQRQPPFNFRCDGGSVLVVNIDKSLLRTLVMLLSGGDCATLPDFVPTISLHTNHGDVWPPPAAYPKPEIDQTGMRFISDQVNAGKLTEAQDVDDTIFDRINAAYGTDYKLRR